MHSHIALSRFACVALLLMVSAAALAQAKVTLRQFVQATKQPVTLGDVADLSAHELRTLLRLIDIPLVSGRQTGGAIRLQRDDIKQILETRMGDIKAQVSWSGADQVEIASPAHTVDGVDILRAARAGLETKLAATTSSFDVHALREPNDIGVPLGSVTLRTRQLSDAMPFSKRIQVWVDIYVSGRLVRTVPVPFEVNVYSPLRVATVLPAPAFAQDDGSRGVCSTNVESVVRSVPRSAAIRRLRRASQAPGSPNVVAYQQPARTIVDSQPKSAANALSRSTRSAVAPDAPAVTKGGWATLRAQSGLVTLESKVKVLQDGRIGDYVLVRSAHSGSAILAHVSSSEQVEIVDR